jgi:outer membrane protein TolC
LIETSLANNYDLQIAIQKIEMARNNVRFIKGALLPTLNRELWQAVEDLDYSPWMVGTPVQI